MLPSAINSPLPQFTTKTGLTLPGVTAAQWEQMWGQLVTEYGVSPTQVVEAASYSMAMVVRYALGLSALSGNVGCLFRDSLGGWIALATLRHLANSGANVWAVSLGDLNDKSQELLRQTKTLERMGVQIAAWTSIADNQELEELVLNCHNVLCGLYKTGAPLDAEQDSIINILNENQTPIHCVEAPVGINVDSGQGTGNPLFASSTLSLGAPFVGLNSGYDFVGRHYLCDISFTREISPFDFGTLFAEQPVVQIISAAREAAEADADVADSSRG